jgi:sugar phosphate permease
MAIGESDSPVNDTASAGFLLSIIGISNTLSRVILGYLSDKPWVNRLYLYNTALAICGISRWLLIIF